MAKIDAGRYEDSVAALCVSPLFVGVTMLCYLSITSCLDRNIRDCVPFQVSLRTAQYSLSLTQRDHAAEEGIFVGHRS
jgi:hypothetical protein